MSVKLECPICLYSINNEKADFIATTCGHCFHASCLVRHLFINGFSCPYCRNIMAENSIEKGKEEPETELETELDTENDGGQIVVREKLIEGTRYLIDKYNNLYHYEIYVNEGVYWIIGLWDPVLDRVLDRVLVVE